MKRSRMCVQCGYTPCRRRCRLRRQLSFAKDLSPETARDWRARCRWLVDHYGCLVGLVDAVLEEVDSPAGRKAQEERNKLVAVLLGAFEEWRQ